jgi:ABC-type oligopeptide transport system substrate-binding subunit
MKLKILLLLVAVFFTALAAPAQKKVNRAKKKPEKLLHTAIAYRFRGEYDPTRGYAINLRPLFYALYSTLFRVDAQLQPYPYLVESYERQGKTAILQIKKDAVFSDGTPITAEDAVRSIELGMMGSYPTPMYRVIEGGEQLFRGETDRCAGIEVLGPKRFKVRLVNENIRFAYYLTSSTVSILPRREKRKSKKLAYSGPFQLVDQRELETQTILTLKRNPRYIGKKSKLDTIYIHFYHSHADFRRAIRDGIPGMFLYNQDYRIPVSRYKYNYFKTPTYGAFYLMLNPRKGPFRDKRLRTFLRDFLVQLDVSGSEGWALTTPAKLVLPHSLTGHSVFKQIRAGDLKQSMPAKRVTIRCLNNRTMIKYDLFTLLKRKLLPFNVDLELRWKGETEPLHQGNQRDFDLTAYNYLVDVPLSIYFYETLFSPGHELNMFDYDVPDARGLLAAYLEESDELAKLKILARLEEMAQAESFVVPVMSPLSLLGSKRFVENARIDKYMKINFEEIDVQKRN